MRNNTKGGECLHEEFTQRRGGAEGAELLFERLLSPESGFMFACIFFISRNEEDLCVNLGALKGEIFLVENSLCLLYYKLRGDKYAADHDS